MRHPLIFTLSLFLFIMSACQSKPKVIGRFDTQADLLLANFDCKTDVDDLHSAAALHTVLSHEDFSKINYHVVAGTYGTQEGLYVPGESLFEHCFGNKWSDAHADLNKALSEVFVVVRPVLNDRGTVWIAEAGQSDFSAALVRKIQKEMPHINTKMQVVIIQHSDWNEEVTTAADLTFVKKNTLYTKIADGNTLDNGTPGYRSEAAIDWSANMENQHVAEAWAMAIAMGQLYNGVDGRYENGAITKGGLDFSDHSEVSYMLGLEGIRDANEFFERMSH